MEKFWKCPTCQKQLPNASSYLIHCHEHNVLSSKKGHYPCPVCPASVGSKSSFFAHMKTHKPISKKEETPGIESSDTRALCSHCLDFFDSYESWQKHIKTLEQTEKVNCPRCPTKNITVCQYKVHKSR